MYRSRARKLYFRSVEKAKAVADATALVKELEVRANP